MTSKSVLYYGYFKRLADFSVCLAVLIILSPLFGLLALAIYSYDRQDPIFRQVRLGRHRKPFTMFKFRSMTVGSEKHGSGYYCYENDPRITPIGLLLRKYSLDELPQLLNVLRGEMSLIGPRPPVHDELDNESFDELHLSYLDKRFVFLPGLTGLAQVRGRNELEWNEKLEFDNIYYREFHRHPFLTDLKIFLNTFSTLFSSQGEFDSKTSQSEQ
jgi:lipopolysaccharide/colanic/teichoic acid biosynthesis glycosyltransferase